MSNLKRTLDEKKKSLLLTRFTSGTLVLNMGTIYSQGGTETLLGKISLTASGIILIINLYHANNLKFDIDEAKDKIATMEEIKER